MKAETEAWLRSPSYDGLLISTSALHHVPPGTLPEGYPVVALGESMEDPAVDHVAIDNDAGLELATRHLLEFGRRRVAFVGGSLDGGTGMVVQRIRGYVRALVAAGMEVDDALVVPTSRGLDGGRAAAAMILSAGADGAGRLHVGRCVLVRRESTAL